MNQKTLLTIIAVVLIGIFAVMVMEANKESPSERMAESFENVTDEIADEIDDNTTN